MTYFGASETDALVKRWLLRNGIDPNIVSGYAIEANSHDLRTITLKCYFSDLPATEPTEKKEE